MELKTPAPSPGFALPSFAWSAGAICAFAPLAGALGRAVNGQLTWGAFGGALGVAAALGGVPVAAAWLAWRFCGRRERLRDGAFFVVLAALVLGLVRHAVQENTARQAAVKTQAEALATQLVQREATGETQPISSPTSPIAAANSAVTQPILDAQRAVKARLDAVQLAYDVAADAVAPSTFFDLAALDTLPAIVARRGKVEAFAQANRLLHEAASLGAFYFSSELRDRAVPEETVREAVAVYRAATKKHLPRMKQLRDKDGAMVLLMQQFLQFAEGQHGRWRVGEQGHVVFDDPQAKQRYDEIVSVARVLEADQQRLRRELSGGQPPR